MRRILIIFGVLLVLVAGTKVWYSNALAAPCAGKLTSAELVTVQIAEGDSPDAVVRKLQDKGVIKSATATTWHLRFSDVAKDFKAGTHSVSCHARSPQILQKLTEQPEQTQFTIKEGATQQEIARLLAEQGIADEKRFADLNAKDFPEYEFLKQAPDDASLEGFLFPETYATPRVGTSDRDVAKIMLEQFERVYTEQLRSKGVPGRPNQSFYQTLIVASMLEEEVRSDADRRTVAGIIYRRLNEGIRLDIDATTRYALDKPTGTLTADDLDSDDPYNTRKFKGLPPGPISNPGLSSLLAAFNPQESDYLFYLSDKQGTTRYARTNAEHEANKERYL